MAARGSTVMQFIPSEITQAAALPDNPTVGQLVQFTGVTPNELLMWTGKGINPTQRRYAASIGGNQVEIPDMSDDYALSVTVKNIATQAGSGTASPTNVRAISGKSSLTVRRAGKNLFPTRENQTINGVTKNVNSDGEVTLNGTASATTWFTMNLPVMLNGVLIMSANNPTANSGVSIRVGKSDSTYPIDLNLNAANKVSAAVSVADGIFVDIRVAAGTVLSNFVIKPQLELGAAATEFEKYAATDYALTPDAALYGYAGSEDEIGSDGHATHRTIFGQYNGTEAWAVTSLTGTNTMRFNGPAITTGQNSFANGLCSHFGTNHKNSMYASDTEGWNFENNRFSIRINKTRLPGYTAGWTDAQALAAFKTLLGTWNTAGTPLQAVAVLSTPATATVAPVEINGADGTNTVTSDGASVAVDYTGSGWAAIGRVQRLAIEAVEITPELGIKVSQVLTDGTATKNVYTRLYSKGLEIYDADTGDMIGGLIYKNGEVYLFATALADPRVDSSFLIDIISSTNKIGLRFKNSAGTIGNISAWDYSGERRFFIDGSGNPVYISSEGLANGYSVQGSIYISNGTVTISAGGLDNNYMATIRLFYGDSTVSVGGHLNPDATNTYNLGNSATPLRWRRLYCVNAPDVSSDARLKQDIADIDGDLVLRLRPRAYRMKSDPEKLHFGLIAQEVKAVMDDLGIPDADLYGDENPDSLSLRYEQLIAPLIAVVQNQQRRIDDLETRLRALEERAK